MYTSDLAFNNPQGVIYLKIEQIIYLSITMCASVTQKKNAHQNDFFY